MADELPRDAVADDPSRTDEEVECPECGGPSTAPALQRWGNCRACRTAQSRLVNPLRW